MRFQSDAQRKAVMSRFARNTLNNPLLENKFPAIRHYNENNMMLKKNNFNEYLLRDGLPPGYSRMMTSEKDALQGFKNGSVVFGYNDDVHDGVEIQNLNDFKKFTKFFYLTQDNLSEDDGSTYCEKCEKRTFGNLCKCGNNKLIPTIGGYDPELDEG